MTFTSHDGATWLEVEASSNSPVAQRRHGTFGRPLEMEGWDLESTERGPTLVL
jgi:hypothetical protein